MANIPAGDAVPTGGRQPRSEQSTGLIYGVLAYGLWGLLPLYFLMLAPTGALEIVAWRVLFSLVFCSLLITVMRKWGSFLAVLRKPRIVWTMGLAGLLIFINWQTYVYAATTGHVVEAALGYFINPIVTVLLGVILLRERLKPIQWVSVGLSLLAVVVLTVGHGSLLWISLALAFSFGFYGLIKKRVGGDIDAVAGLTFGTVSPWHTVGLLAAGVVTAVPLLFFAAAARRLPLTYLGLIQFFAPVLQFLVGVFILHEAMPLQRWVGFGMVWAALLILTVDMVVSGRTPRRTSLEPA
jgi:chloramphenicol-sensitive protein RarD